MKVGEHQNTTTMKTVIPHVMVFPYPAQGHINAMLGLSDLLNIAGICVTCVTCVTTDHILHKLSNTSLNNAADLFSFCAVPDGLPDDHDRSPQDRDLIHSLHMHAAPALRRILSSSGDGSTPVTCIVADGIMSFIIDIGKEHSIPVLSFRTISACRFWSYFCLPALVKDGILPFNDGESCVPSAAMYERGRIVSWAPQIEVLRHPAVGGFLTHSGWNSTLDGLTEGVPMVCWPYFAGQQINSRYVSDVWKVGLDMKDTCDRVIVEKMVREMMEGERSVGMRRSASEFAEKFKSSISEGGSSYAELQRLIHDIRFPLVQGKFF